MTDRDPIAAALEDLRKREENERLHHTFPYLWDPSAPSAEVVPGDIVDLAASQGIALGGSDEGPDQVDAWQAQLDAISPGRSDLALVGLQHTEMMSNAANLLRQDGLEPANLRELLCCPARFRLSRRREDEGIRIWALDARNPESLPGSGAFSFLQPRAPGFPALRTSMIDAREAGPQDLFLVRLDTAARRRLQSYALEFPVEEQVPTP